MVLTIFSICIFAQESEKPSWESCKIEQCNIINALPDMLKHDLIFYGFIHGAALPQQVDAKILIELMGQGLKYYAPEVSYSGAYFINKYLKTGNVRYLKYVLRYYIAQQDASVQWIKKYEEIYNFMQQSGNPLVVLGTDVEINDNLITTHLANLLGERRSGIAIVDSLAQFSDLEDELIIWSGKPVMKLSKEHGLTNEEVLYDVNAQPNFTKRFFEFYKSNMNMVSGAFGKVSLEIKKILEKHLMRESNREQFITENFESMVLPIIDEGEKVYSNFGYAHILQDRLSDKMFLAGILKEKYPKLKIYSILTQMADGEVLDKKKFCKNGCIKRYEKKIKLASICGSITSKKLDGDTKNERVKGIDALKSSTAMGEATIIPINVVNKELQKQLYYLDYEEGKNSEDLSFEKNTSTSNYFQALIFIRGSEANDTYEMY